MSLPKIPAFSLEGQIQDGRNKFVYCDILLEIAYKPTEAVTLKVFAALHGASPSLTVALQV